MLGGDWTIRAGAAMAGIYGNDAAEAMYPLLATANDGKKPDCGKNRYTLTFPAGELPPAYAFWSVTMYDAKTQLLVANPIKRYLINSPMLPDLKKNSDGSLTVYIQSASPGADKEANWLPAPAGPVYVVMRIDWPKEAALKGRGSRRLSTSHRFANRRKAEITMPLNRPDRRVWRLQGRVGSERLQASERPVLSPAPAPLRRGENARGWLGQTGHDDKEDRASPRNHA